METISIEVVAEFIVLLRELYKREKKEQRLETKETSIFSEWKGNT